MSCEDAFAARPQILIVVDRLQRSRRLARIFGGGGVAIGGIVRRLADLSDALARQRVDAVVTSPRFLGAVASRLSQPAVSAPANAKPLILLLLRNPADLGVIGSAQKADGWIFEDWEIGRLRQALLLARFGLTVLPDIRRLLGGRMARRRTSRLDDLSDLQRRTLKMLSHGLSNKDIAVALSVGEATVKAAVRGIIIRLGLRNRTEAAVFAASHYRRMETERPT
ncbi:LuxR C-terminal-related transcriptional regulator [Inquilinus sp. CAU 1745]|uniref:LuxR C-terminal-related transcriptional regulator n=1 Tax=Inquilinus sp. CAU 1745 TaxID=3140369 RepID=UPI00325AF47B